MRRLLLACLGWTALTAATALAADVPPPGYRLSTPRASAYVPFFTWNGLYVGLNAAYGRGRSAWDSATRATDTFHLSGAQVGGTVGYNVQRGAWVFGIEADFDWSDVKGSTNFNCVPGCETRNTWLGTARGRLGYAIGRWLPYLTGGAAFGDVKASSPGTLGATGTQVGWTAGGGLEYAFVGNWSAKLEYLYTDLGSFDCGTACGATAPDRISFNTNLLRLGINYKF